jgi:hypothetical protein
MWRLDLVQQIELCVLDEKRDWRFCFVVAESHLLCVVFVLLKGHLSQQLVN